MRPYLAIIKDSFRAAIASRVLYVLLALITLFLLALAPISLTQTLTTEVSFEHLTDPTSSPDPQTRLLRLFAKLVDSAEDDKTSKRKQIWDRLSPVAQEDLRERLEDAKLYTSGEEQPVETDPFNTYPARLNRTAQSLVADLNRVIDGESLYDENIWRKQRLGKEAEELIDQPVPLNREQTKRLNRILVSATFPGEIAAGSETSLIPGYLHWEWDPIPLRREEIKTVFGNWLPYILDKFVLSIGVFIAILVTAPLIPQTFDSGSLNLLLSKPVSRSLLLIAKFIGGCAFVAICATYLFVGLWLLSGLRLGIWNSAILISIPIYVLVFAIYYSVSVAAGVFWRNTIMCIVMAILFWLVCFSIGTLNSRLDGGVSSQELVNVQKAGDGLVSVDYSGVPYHWDTREEDWDIAFQNKQDGQQFRRMIRGMSFLVGQAIPFPPPMGPVYLEDYGVVIVGQFEMSEQGAMKAPALVVASPKQLQFGVSVTDLPRNTVALLKDHQGRLLIICNDGRMFRLKAEELEKFLLNEASADGDIAAEDDSPSNASEPEEGEKKEKPTRKKKNIFSEMLGSMVVYDYFEQLDVGGQFLVPNSQSVTIDSASGRIAIASGNDVVLLEPDGNGYNAVKDLKFDLPEEISAIKAIGLSGNHLTIARGNGDVLLLDSSSGDLLKTFRPENTSIGRTISANIESGDFAVLFTNGNLWMIDSASQSIAKPRVRGQGDISASKYSDGNNLFVVDRITRVSTYNSRDFDRTAELSPKLSWTNSAFRYVLHPMYVIFPKPGEFYKLIDHLTASSSKDADLTNTVATQSVRSNPWSPLWSGLAFMAVVLLLACFYFERQEY